MKESVCGLNTFVGVWAFTMLFGTLSVNNNNLPPPPPHPPPFKWEIHCDATKYFVQIGLSWVSEWYWCASMHKDEGMTWLTAIILFCFILFLKMEIKYEWPGLMGAKIVKWGWVIWFLSVQRSIKKTEYFIVCVLPTSLPKQSALLLLANMYLANIYNFISYLAVLFNLSVNVIRSEEFGTLSCHPEKKKKENALQYNRWKHTIFFNLKNKSCSSHILMNNGPPENSSLQNHKT